MKQFLPIQAKTNKSVSNATRGRRKSQPIQDQSKQRERIPDIHALEDEADKGATQAEQGRKFHIEQVGTGGGEPGVVGAPIQMLGEEKKKRQPQQARLTTLQAQPQQAQLITLQQPQRAYVE